MALCCACRNGRVHASQLGSGWTQSPTSSRWRRWLCVAVCDVRMFDYTCSHVLVRNLCGFHACSTPKPQLSPCHALCITSDQGDSGKERPGAVRALQRGRAAVQGLGQPGWERPPFALFAQVSFHLAPHTFEASECGAAPGSELDCMFCMVISPHFHVLN